MTYVEQQQSDADDSVVTSARPLNGIQAGFDPEATWTGDEEVSELDGLRRRNAFVERWVENLREQLPRERARASACISRGLSAVPDDDLLAEVQRRGFERPVPATAVSVARDDAGDHAAQNASERLR
jgi:hypothetical protein